MDKLFLMIPNTMRSGRGTKAIHMEDPGVTTCLAALSRGQRRTQEFVEAWARQKATKKFLIQI
jgi:hypothetical protein